MGEFSASDCSWKKMVIAKANNKWMSTIKVEPDVNNATKTISFSLEEESPIEVKTEMVHEEPNEQSFQNQVMRAQPAVTMEQELDPLLVAVPESPERQRRRRGSGPKTETQEERMARLAKMSAYAAQRLASETPEQRSMRLARMSQYAARRLSQETREQRAKRLSRMSAYAARRLAQESPEQRQARLSRMSAYAAKRHALRKVISSITSENSKSSNDDSQITNNMSDQS